MKWWWQKESDDYNYKPKLRRQAMRSAKLVHDLSYLKANFKNNKGEKVIIFKLAPDTFVVVTSEHDAQNKYGRVIRKISRSVRDAEYFPLPTASPQPKRVKLETVNGDVVMCDFVVTHKLVDDTYMAFSLGASRQINHVVKENGCLYSFSDGYRPLHPTNPILAAIEQIKRDHCVRGAEDDIANLEELVKRECGLL